MNNLPKMASKNPERGPSLRNVLVEKRDSQTSVPQIVKKNDIRDIRSIRQLSKVHLDLDSPRMRAALDTLGVGEDEL